VRGWKRGGIGGRLVVVRRNRWEGRNSNCSVKIADFSCKKKMADFSCKKKMADFSCQQKRWQSFFYFQLMQTQKEVIFFIKTKRRY
jgi:hypothetical protein